MSIITIMGKKRRDMKVYKNLRRALYDNKISTKKYADILHANEKIITSKINGSVDFTYPEFLKTCTLLPEYNADYLFAAFDNESG